MLNKEIKLWDGENAVRLKTYIIDGCLKNSDKNGRVRGAVLICPGGGYCFCSEREAEPIALRFLAAGYHAFVLTYTTTDIDKNMRHPKPLLDASRAVTIIRGNADEWNIDRNKIAVCGFSAGGHLAASLATLGNRDYIKNADGIGDNMPNALILGYPVISANWHVHGGSFINLIGTEPAPELVNEVSLEKQVSKFTPHTFIFHTVEDNAVPVENSMMFASALRKNGVLFEAHLYAKGSHGLSLANAEVSDNENGINPHFGTWINLAVEWLDDEFSSC